MSLGGLSRDAYLPCSPARCMSNRPCRAGPDNSSVQPRSRSLSQQNRQCTRIRTPTGIGPARRGRVVVTSHGSRIPADRAKSRYAIAILGGSAAGHAPYSGLPPHRFRRSVFPPPGRSICPAPERSHSRPPDATDSSSTPWYGTGARLRSECGISSLVPPSSNHAGCRRSPERAPMFRRRKRNTETYTTSDWDGARPHQAPKNPVVAIGVRPDGPIYRLDDIQDCYGPKKWISIGSGDDNDIQLHEKIPRGKRRSISWNHCELCRTPQGRVMVKQCEDAYNTTKVNGARVRGGMVRAGARRRAGGGTKTAHWHQRKR